MSNTDLLFDGHSIKGIPGLIVTDWMPMLTGLIRRGDNDVVANRDGVLGNQLPLAAFNFVIPVVIAGDTEAEIMTNFTAAATALDGLGGLGTMERRWDNGTGYTSSYARGQFGGLQPSNLNYITANLDLVFGNLDGCWFTNSDLTVPRAI